jgi:hypothetical protein
MAVATWESAMPDVSGTEYRTAAKAPEFVWELSLGIYLMVKGFKASGIERLQVDRRAVPTPHAVPVP